MRYDEMRSHVREHFGELLQSFRDSAAENGPVVGQDLEVLRGAQGLAQADAATFAATVHEGGERGLLKEFCEARGIEEVPTGDEGRLLLDEFLKGYREYLGQALEHTEQFDTLDLAQEDITTPQQRPTAKVNSPPTTEALPYSEVVSRYFDEMERTSALAAKTESEKRDALELMSELTGCKPLNHITKSDAQEIKAALFKLPKNRRKNPKTRDMPLREMLESSGVERIAARTLNVYLGHMQSLFTWAVNNGYASENVFAGLKVRAKGRSDNEGRKAFSPEQLRQMFSHLTDPHSSLVKKDTHKWPALIGMFTGMRLNEIAQLEISDINQAEDVWCINVTPDGNDQKRVKNASSRRRVPLHDKLIECGLLAFLEEQKRQGHSRLFPSLTYSPQNGYGRNAGRWFNERFLPALDLGSQGYVFHCLRHTMITRLAQADVEEPKLKSLVGHSQSGVTYGTYFGEGFRPEQLRDAINKFDIEG